MPDNSVMLFATSSTVYFSEFGAGNSTLTIHKVNNYRCFITRHAEGGTPQMWVTNYRLGEGVKPPEKLWSNALNPISLSETGYMKLANGLILQWGYLGQSANANYVPLTFPITFPTKLVYAAPTPHYNHYSWLTWVVGQPSRQGCDFYVSQNGSTLIYPQALNWFAIGY